MASEVLILNQSIENAKIADLEKYDLTGINPYLHKNLILAEHKYAPKKALENENFSSSHVIVDEAIQFKNHNYSIQELYRVEPDILRDYYSDYPDSFSEFPEYPI